MNTVSACPGPLALQEYLLGRTSEATAAAVEEHLASCLKCQQQLPTIPAEDDFVADFRACAGMRQPNNPLLDRLAGNLRNLLRPDSPMTRDATPPADGEATPPPADVASNDAEDVRTLLAPPREPDELGRLGSYRILKVLGAGGMGVVFLAEDVQLRRKVAVKAMRPALAARATARQRFVREAQLTAALSHDHVVAIHQVGEENGVPFLAMPLLEGESLDARLKREGRLPVGEVLRIGREAAKGLAAAHEHGLIHRDIKPANLWLEGSRGRVKVLDFGLVRASDGDAHLTQTGVILGTPAYMAPEQAGGAVDHRADLFSLGCVLYRMATGQLPFPGDTAYEVLAKVATDRPRPPHELNADVPPALSDLIVRLLDKDRTARPESASAVVAALKEHQERAVEAIPLARPVAPHEEATDPWATLEVMERQAPAPARRRLWRVAVAPALVLAVSSALIAGIVVIIRNKDGKEVARVSVPDGVSAEVKPDGDNPKPEPLPPPDGGAPMVPAALVAAPAKLDGVRSWTIETVPPRGEMWAVHLSPDGKLLAAGGDDGTVRLWDTATGRLARALITGQGQIQFLAWLPDSTTLAVGGAESSSIALWDTAAGRVVRKIGTDIFWRKAALSPDGKTLATVMGQPIQLWDTTSGKQLRTSPVLKSAVEALVWSPDGTTLALGLASGDVELWPVAEQQVLTLTRLKKDGPLPAMGAVGWSSDGKTLAAAGRQGEIGIWDVASRKLLRTLDKQTDAGLVGLQLSDDLQTLYVICISHIRELDANTGKVTSTGPQATLGGDFLGGLGSRDGTVGCWACRSMMGWTYRTKEKETRYFIQMLLPPRGMIWSRSGEKVVSVGGRLTFWLPAQGTMVRGYEQSNSGGWGVRAIMAAFSSDEKRLAAGSSHEGLLWVYDTRNGQQIAQQQAHEGSCRAVSWSPDDKWIATAGDDKVVRTWAATEPFRPVSRFEGHEKPVTTVAWSPDSKTLASGSADGTVRLWDVGTGKHRRTLKTGLNWVISVAWSPDGKAVAVAGDDRLAQVWSAESGEPLPCQAAFPHGAGNSVRWSAAGTTLVCTGVGGTSRLYDVKTWEIQKEVAGSSLSPDLSLYFAPDGYRLCETKTGRCVGSLVPLHKETGIAISADGHYRGTIKDPDKQTAQIVYVVQTEKGQETLTPEEFSKRFGWKNDPDKVRLTGRR